MSRILVLTLSTSLIILTGACGLNSRPDSSESRKREVTDTLGKVFSVSCSESLLCTLVPQDPMLKPLSCDSNSDGTDTFVLGWGTSILTARAVAAPESGSISLNAAAPAHPIACASDADCLPDLFSENYSCTIGLCQHSDYMLTIDVAALCQADLPWPTSCPYDASPLVASRLAEVASFCGTSTECSNVPAVPAACRQVAELCPEASAPSADGMGVTCSPVCTPGEECLGGSCVPLSPWAGMVCGTTEDCPSYAKCCDGSDETCAGTRLPAGDGTNPGEYEIGTDGLTVTDTITGLVWQRESNGKGYGLEDAKAYCASLGLGGVSGWRLPTAMELITIVDFTKAKPAIDRRAFPNMPSRRAWFLTSSLYVYSDGLESDPFVVDFSNGGDPGYGGGLVLCVR